MLDGVPTAAFVSVFAPHRSLSATARNVTITPLSSHKPCQACATNTPPPPQTPKRKKPRGYWSNAENVKKELITFSQTCDEIRAGEMPTAGQLRKAGRRDLDNAITSMGGYKKVGEQFQLGCARDGRRANGYWERFDNLEQELKELIREHSVGEGRMPTFEELRKWKRGDIVEGIGKHGGSAKVANRMGLGERRVQKGRGYWAEWARVEEEIVQFVKERDGGKEADGSSNNSRMPSQRELRNAGRSDLAQAISKYHGGFRQAAVRLGYMCNKKDDFYYNQFYNVAQEVYNLMEQAGEEGVMPGSKLLKTHGRSDISAAIGRFGGMSKVSQRLGLQYQVRTRETFKEWGAFQRSLLRFTERHGRRGELPSARTLINFGRDDLHQAVLHHGGARQVAERMGLRRNHWLDFHHVARQVLGFVEVHGSVGVMPTEMEFEQMGRSGLNVAVGKFGYGQVAERLGLRQHEQSTQMAFRALLGECQRSEME